MKELPPAGIVLRVNNITTAKLDTASWRFGKEPYSRQDPAPAVSPWTPFFAFTSLFLRPDPSGRPQKFPSQQTHDGPNPHILAPDREVSDGEDEVDEVGIEPDDEDAGAGGDGAAGGRQRSQSLQDWSEDDLEDVVDAPRAPEAAAEDRGDLPGRGAGDWRAAARKAGAGGAGGRVAAEREEPDGGGAGRGAAGGEEGPARGPAMEVRLEETGRAAQAADPDHLRVSPPFCV